MKRMILSGVAVITAAFVLTSAIMFWVPLFERSTGWYAVGYYDVYDYSYPMVDELKKRSPMEERTVLDEMFEELKQSPRNDLLRIEAAEQDVCAQFLVDCQGLTPDKVQKMVKGAMRHQDYFQQVQTRETARTANLISSGSLFIAVLALIIAALTFIHKVKTERNASGLTTSPSASS